MAPHEAAVAVPIRAFTGAKSRLGARLTGAERAALMRTMAERVVTAAGALPVAVVSSAPEVEAWAGGLGATVIADPGTLDGAAAAGRRWAARLGVPRVVVAHADLPLVESLARLAAPGGEPVAVLVPCHRDDGTPLLSVPVTAPFAFSYGPGSFARHAAEARRAGLKVVELRDDPTLRRDVDSLDDLPTGP